jgi:predicted NACHT family NTPase
MKEYIFNPNDFDMEVIKNLDYEFYFETTNFLTIQKACKEAKMFSRLISIIGDPGFGKSNALQYFSKNNVNVYYTLQ